MYSAKHIDSKTFILETKTILGIPPEVAVGISYRAIMNEYGQRPPYNCDNPLPAAIHLDVDDLDHYFKMMDSESTAEAMKMDGVKRETVKTYILDKTMEL